MTGSEPRHGDHPVLYRIGDGEARATNPEIVGVKAHNLMRMSEAGLPVPAGFVLGADMGCFVRDRRQGLGDEGSELVAEGLRSLEHETGLRFGARRCPLLLAVRSGAAVSMPGMLDTLLNIGLSDETLPGLLRATGDPVFVWDSYRRLVQAYAETVEGFPPEPFAAVVQAAMEHGDAPTVAELDVAALRGVVRDLQAAYRSLAGRPFPQDPMEQLERGIEAVFRSWDTPRAVEYRTLQGLNTLTGTAVTVQAMVFGNRGVTSGSGVGFTRDPGTGDNRLYVDFLLNAQGEDVVGGRARAPDPELSIGALPGLAGELDVMRARLERIFGDAQDFEFTVEEGRLWMLQTRTAKRTPWAALRIACDLVDEGLIDRSTAVRRLAGYDLDNIARRCLRGADRVTPLASGVSAGSGVACGRVALVPDTVDDYAARGDPIVLVRAEASTDDITDLARCDALVTVTGARTAHAAVVARQLGVICVVGCADVTIDTARRELRAGNAELHEGDLVTVDGEHGYLYAGKLDVEVERPRDLVERVRAWQQPGQISTAAGASA